MQSLQQKSVTSLTNDRILMHNGRWENFLTFTESGQIDRFFKIPFFVPIQQRGFAVAVLA